MIEDSGFVMEPFEDLFSKAASKAIPNADIRSVVRFLSKQCISESLSVADLGVFTSDEGEAQEGMIMSVLGQNPPSGAKEILLSASISCRW